jgi:16S rRNA (cytidine1402-2'-O)-methyltransferase
MPNTLDVVGVPAVDPRDLTLRARQILASVRCVAACDLAQAQQFLAGLNLWPALVAADEQEEIWRALGSGDVALLSSEGLRAASGGELALIHAAADRGVPVVAVPGPVLPVTALVISGLPADSFCFLGQPPATDRWSSLPPPSRSLVGSGAALWSEL